MKFSVALTLFLASLVGAAQAESNPASFGQCMYYCQQYEPAARNRCIETLCGSVAPEPQAYAPDQNNFYYPQAVQQQQLNALAVQIAQAEARVEAARLRLEETRPRRRVASFDPFAVSISDNDRNPDHKAAEREFKEARKALSELQDRAQSVSSSSPLE